MAAPALFDRALAAAADAEDLAAAVSAEAAAAANTLNPAQGLGDISRHKDSRNPPSQASFSSPNKATGKGAGKGGGTQAQKKAELARAASAAILAKEFSVKAGGGGGEYAAGDVIEMRAGLMPFSLFPSDSINMLTTTEECTVDCWFTVSLKERERARLFEASFSFFSFFLGAS